ncbi:hypothetical protein AVEN_92533-1 [Araneus ventricosus]|uniref:Uncharacterized protein n=1 Tax=Araneus ventricosus TaxID=182803 RepID=A0A4Y2AHW0_ARAVE|nr:hypothetical protein AVEN_92533-1 [Araneus ventricosus]
MWLGTSRLIHWGPQCITSLMGRHARPTRGVFGCPLEVRIKQSGGSFSWRAPLLAVEERKQKSEKWKLKGKGKPEGRSDH